MSCRSYRPYPGQNVQIDHTEYTDSTQNQVDNTDPADRTDPASHTHLADHTDPRPVQRYRIHRSDSGYIPVINLLHTDPVPAKHAVNNK